MRYNKKNREILARIVVDNYDMDTLVTLAIEDLERYYADHPEQFKTDAKDFGV